MIADIDPMFMHEGKPRPQALAIPLQLVAYLPIVEVQGQKAFNFSSEVESAIRSIGSLQENYVVRPSDIQFSDMQASISKILDGTDDNAFSERIKHWQDHWRVNPLVGAPPALIDWLWVDTTATEKNFSTVFVPNWGGEIV